MKLLMTADAVGGVWTYALELARALRPRGVRTVLATMGPRPTDEQRAEAASVPDLALVESEYKLEWMDEPWADVQRAGEWLLSMAEREAPDVVHLNGYTHAALPWKRPTVVVGHSDVLSWWESVHAEPAPPTWERYREAVRKGLGSARMVVTPTEAMMRALERNYGPLRRARVIHNGLPRDRDPVEKEPMIFGAGRLWDDAKNMVALARVAGELPWPVYLAGDATSPDGAGTPPAGANYLGRLSRDAVGGWYDRAAIYAHPARYEPFGLAPLEAGLSGCALVLGDIPSLRELWGDAAVFVPPGDDGALLDALRDLIEDPERRAELSAASRERASRYTTQRMVVKYLEAYAETMASEAIAEANKCAS